MDLGLILSVMHFTRQTEMPFLTWPLLGQSVTVRGRRGWSWGRGLGRTRAWGAGPARPSLGALGQVSAVMVTLVSKGPALSPRPRPLSSCLGSIKHGLTSHAALSQAGNRVCLLGHQ